MLESEWARKPSLLLLLFAPGAELAESLLRVDGLFGSSRDLAMRTAESLWIPNRSADCASFYALWPFATMRAAEPIALIGSDFESDPGASAARVASPRRRSSRWKSPCAGPSCRRIKRLIFTRRRRSQERPVRLGYSSLEPCPRWTQVVHSGGPECP